MQDPMKGIYDFIVILNEKLPGMGILNYNGSHLPPTVLFNHVHTSTVDELIRPLCKKIEEENDFTLRVDYDENRSLLCCIHVIDQLDSLGMYIRESLNKVLTVDTHYVEVQMQKDLYSNVIQDL